MSIWYLASNVLFLSSSIFFERSSSPSTSLRMSFWNSLSISSSSSSKDVSVGTNGISPLYNGVCLCSNLILSSISFSIWVIGDCLYGNYFSTTSTWKAGCSNCFIVWIVYRNLMSLHLHLGFPLESYIGDKPRGAFLGNWCLNVFFCCCWFWFCIYLYFLSLFCWKKIDC